MIILRVALPVPVPQLFDYSTEDGTEADVGRCVRVPFGKGARSGLILAVDTHSEVAGQALKPAGQILRDVAPLPPDWLELVQFVARYYHAPLGEVIALALPPHLRRADGVDGREVDPLLTPTAAGLAALAAARRSSRALRLLEALAARANCRRSDLRGLPDGMAVGELLRRGWAGPADRASPLLDGPPGPDLTPGQAAALTAITGAPPGFQAWLLHGVTGSGKTEVYLRLVRHVLAQGGQVLMLVPEIALTPQLEGRVADRFPAARVVSLNSSQAEGARSRGFVQALSGQADIVLGTRLALFTPLPRLGLIVVDEEHDTSYKQQEGVRYSARDMAVWRARQRGIPVVLGSATPSVESWHHAQTGRYRLLTLAERAVALSLPATRWLDTRRIRLDEGLSPQLVDALGQRLARGEQSLVFLNRRGYAPVLSCPACAWVSDCPHCSAHLVVHLADRRLRCHHCGWDAPVPRACPTCGNLDIHPLGRGTQRLEARLAELFPAARILRVDRDAVRTRSQWESLLAKVEAGEADILVGTQMMAKGHDFPGLTLVAVVGADGALFAADFRAPERLFQQLMQVGGRAGRAHLPGEVLIQTEHPEHPLFPCLVRHDYPAFATRILAERRGAGFPPFSYQAMLRADAPVLEDALTFLGRAIEGAQACQPGPVRLFDPVPMRLTRLARRERAQLLLECPERGPLQAFLGRWEPVLYKLGRAREVRWHLDVDPADV
ncbi:MAG: primosomal protein N' [Rhodocyclaceae bacterium]|jgi:primosomal protein N' (replication factor Y)|nr:primosomal protein N' [Rhodocyclaceae bacterium]